MKRNITKAFFILRYNDVNNDNVLAAFEAAKEISIHQIQSDKYLPVERQLRIMEIAMLLIEHGRLRHGIASYCITTKGKLYLISKSYWWGIWGTIAGVLALVLMLLLEWKNLLKIFEKD